jgi:hypothetical protein
MMHTLLPQEEKPEVAKDVEPQGQVYSKDDFFDSLSCEALERLKVAHDDGGPRAHDGGGGGGGNPSAGGGGGGGGGGGHGAPRSRFAEQRKLDIETFGGTGIARRNNYGRGRGRGRGRGGRGVCVRAAPRSPLHASEGGGTVCTAGKRACMEGERWRVVVFSGRTELWAGPGRRAGGAGSCCGKLSADAAQSPGGQD